MSASMLRKKCVVQSANSRTPAGMKVVFYTADYGYLFQFFAGAN